jgi:hypothetical protein
MDTTGQEKSCAIGHHTFIRKVSGGAIKLEIFGMRKV